LTAKAHFLSVAVKAVTALRDRIGHLFAGVKNTTGSVCAVIKVLGAITVEIALYTSVIRFVA